MFFRRFSDGRSSQVAAYVVDNTDEQHGEQELADLHREVWLQGKAPLLYIAWPARIDILSCARGEDFWDKRNERCHYNPAKKLRMDAIETAGAIAQAFSLHRLDDGTFWEDASHQQLVNHHKMAHSMLIQALVETDQRFPDEKRPVMRRLLLLMVLIKYLEDRRVFPEGWFSNYHSGAESFHEVLSSYEPEKVALLLKALEVKFNGDIFAFPRNEMTTEDLRIFASLVDARLLKQQYFLWKQFSFAHLPVEIISHLYQRFVPDGHGTVYTPPFLATFLLDQAMPYSQLTGQERILDPSCGSGVFLVGAFRRLVQYWRHQHGWQRPDVETLKHILHSSIFGVEFEDFAIDLTAFSLSLALCDALQPEVIWHDLRFDPMRGHNLIKDDFFHVVRKKWQGKETILSDGFDLVIGNPPFKSKLTDDANMVNSEAQLRIPNRVKLPDKQIAYLFLDQAFTLLRPGGNICLIQNNGFLYNNNTKGFRTSLFSHRQVEAIFDLVSIRNLYEGAAPKTVVILACEEKPKADHCIQHWTFRRSASVHERICFEIDYYDRHVVPQAVAISNPFVWRINLLGGGRLHNLSHRLQSLPTLLDYITKKSWKYGDGFIIGNRKKYAPYLYHQTLLPTEALILDGIDSDKLSIVTDDHFEAPRSKEQFDAPLILIKELDSLPMDFVDSGFLAYGQRIVGIHAPDAEVSELTQLFSNLRQRRRIFQLHCALTSMRSLVSKSTSILKADIDRLPYPDDAEDLSLNFWEEALRDDVLDYMTDYVRLGQESALLKLAADHESMRTYSDLFVRMLGSVYENLHADEPIFLDGLICQVFYFGERPYLPWIVEGREEALRALIYQEELSRGLRTIRMVRFHEENALLLVKPDRLRYWIRSTAIRDADDTLTDLYRWGY